MRIRQQGSYKAFFTDSYKTIRFTDATPRTPELEDVAINDKCLANCSYCYTSALRTGSNFSDIIDKANIVWGSLPLNDRPFQIAIGGAGEPTMHPDFIDFVKHIKSIGIVPNYTTNGMHLSDSILKATEDHCGGVALSWHPHIPKVFKKAIDRLKTLNTKLNLHIIVGSDDSVIDLENLYDKYKDFVDYFVILPYQAVGRGQKIQTEENWNKVFSWISSKEYNRQKQFAFGALFYDFIKNHNLPLEMSIYNPDVYSGYRLLNQNYQTLFKSSYELVEKNLIPN